MKTLVFAWRNLWRNPRRTSIALSAVALSTAVLIITYGLTHGMMEQAASNVTNLTVGEVQVHALKYREQRSFYDSIEDPEAILKAAGEMGIGAVARSYGFGLAALGVKSGGALFWGIEPEVESRVFDMAGHLFKGSFLSDRACGEVVLGKKLAYTLNVDIGDEIVVLVQGADGSLGNELYKVVGILKSMGEEIDRTAALLHADDFEELFVSGGRVHEIAMNSRGAVAPDKIAAELAVKFPGEEVLSWRKLLPVIADMMAIFDAVMVFFGGIFCIAAGLGVLNSLLMATYERMKEFGVVKALGATPWRIIKDVAAEALVLAVLATLIGVALGVPGCLLLHKYGINTAVFGGGVSFGGVAFDPIWRATVNFKIVATSVIMMFVFCVLAALYPAILAARLKPVETMRRH